VAARKQSKAPANKPGGKPGRKPAAPRAPRPSPLPDPGGAAPLHELSRDRLSVFLYLALLPEETAALVKAWGLSQPGFRREALGEVQRCDLLADEVRAAPERGAAVLDLLRKAFGGLPMAAWHLDPPGAGELLEVAGHEAALALSLWRVLADRSAAVRGAAGPMLDRQVERFYGPADPGAPDQGAAPPGRPGAEGAAGPDERVRKLTGQLAAAQREAQESARRAEEARLRGEEAREKLQGQLREARAREAQAAEEAARAREAAEAARQGLARAEERLAALRAEDAVSEALRARAAARDLEARAASLESRLARAQEREAELERDLTRARGATAAAPAPPPTAPAEEADGEEAQALWLFPVYTREFYDSIEGWDRRIQRAAFKQAHLLAQDHRHPSLRALPLEGLPGYYRVRVATDVRLLYRRGERQNAVEILSLIDREDLDRYVRQAKTRQS